ncbi:GNAT family N-acetyltransferase [Actinocrispum wychmicini]|uniref:Ribosomal protein S18 acetylase RimI-like enzyme n=1 Tax=Actinocrispum wychmicini TaxID=1213861 RepID=A0A4R2J491_9PSEU|nr:GNAT family N-acetyltransferase [Actinocrispum wychmicini]TCO53491.1 ribosomal protein S18 acetylase RimI-like enzyme [Actinocrispum wychmicini]
MTLSALMIRRAEPSDAGFLTEMLCAAVNWDDGRAALTRAQVLADPTLARYVSGWPRSGDLGVVGERGGPVGAAWLRLFTADEPGYGYVADDVPEVSVAVLPGWRGQGIGAELLSELFAIATDTRVSLSVERANRARELYRRLGFQTVAAGAQSDTMVKILR